ncbi:Oidioi.mRNA.OKI2018_I69.XSR.g14382.t1.cds [Oikopleura dioica]|uniref:Oidioi.mRNA.OKI2018_I69.XSR.g14382.t1.cds n=1 Tax=Oikopleura dioica TaxID=34765 RepID=A0ABN7SIH7_OIKDI|nr:Oidioi.mRNA.OKI2018_I69.XSR.g14382.t1.cds [Oikopleura dioica]
MDTLSHFLRRSSRNRRAMALGNNNASVERVLQEASLLQEAPSAISSPVSSVPPPLPDRPPATQPSRLRTSALRRRATFRTENGDQRLTLRDRRHFLRTLESQRSRSNLLATKSHLSSSVKQTSRLFDIWSEIIKGVQGRHGSFVASYFYFLKSLLQFYALPSFLCILFIYSPYRRHENLTDELNNATSKKFHLKDLVTGEGWFLNSGLYFGSYPTDSALSSYSIPTAYATTILVIFCISAVRIFNQGRRHFSLAVHYQMMSQNGISKLLLSGWDYSIVDPHMANLQKRSNALFIKEKLAKDSRATSSVVIMWTKSAFIWILCLTLVFASCVMIVIIGRRHYDDFLYACKYWYRPCPETEKIPLIIPALTSLLSCLLTRLFVVLGEMEHFNNEHRIILTITRILVMRFALLTSLIYELSERSQNEDCWEDVIAHELYKFFFFDTMCSFLINTIFCECLVSLVRKGCSMRPPVFDVISNGIEIVFGCSITFLGLYFCPLLLLGAVGRVFITFYVKILVVRYVSDEPHDVITLGAISTMTTVSETLSFCYSIILMIAVVLPKNTSNSCGPFRNLEYPLQIFSSLANNAAHIRQAFDKTVSILTSSVLLSLLILSLFGLILVVHTRIRGQNREVHRLKKMLKKRGYTTQLRS